MTDTALPVIPGEQSETRNPSSCSWIPACAGMTNGVPALYRSTSGFNLELSQLTAGYQFGPELNVF